MSVYPRTHNRIAVGPQNAKPAVQSEDVSDLVESNLGFVPDALQKRVLEAASKRVLLNCSRQ
jgi:hypothetical protein